MSDHHPTCGEIWAVDDSEIRWVDEHSTDGTAGKERFVLIATHQTYIDSYNPKYLMVIPISSKRSHEWDYKLERGEHPYSNLVEPSTLRLLMMQPIPKNILTRRIGRLEADVLRSILAKLTHNLGIGHVQDTEEIDPLVAFLRDPSNKRK